MPFVCSQFTRAFLRLSVPKMFQVSCYSVGPTLLKRANEADRTRQARTERRRKERKGRAREKLGHPKPYDPSGITRKGQEISSQKS